MGNQLLQLLNTTNCPIDSFHAAINTKTTYRASSHILFYSGSTATHRRPSTFQNLLRCASILELTCSDMPRHCSLRFSATTKMNALEQRKVCAYLDFNTEQLLKGCVKGGCAGEHLLHPKLRAKTRGADSGGRRGMRVSRLPRGFGAAKARQTRQEQVAEGSYLHWRVLVWGVFKIT